MLLKIESLDLKGQGVAHDCDGKTIFVEGALPFEVVGANIFRQKKNFALAKIAHVLKASPARVLPECPHFGVCGGCVMQHLATDSQLAVKSRVLEDALKFIGGVQAQTFFAPIAGTPWHYRHRARLSVRFVAKKGTVLVGFHEKKSSFIADIQSCAILPKKISNLLIPLRNLIGALSIFEHIPQIELAVGEAMTALVLRILAPLSDADATLLKEFADFHKVVFYLQEKGPDTARRFYPLDNQELFYQLPEFDLKIHFQPTDFTQVNHAVNRILVRRALSLLNPQKTDRIADFFCGLGNFTLPVAKSAAQVLGIEGNAALIARAKESVKINGLANADFAVANLFEESFFADFDFSRFNKLLIDPPREGAIALVKALPENDFAPKRIIYISCNPATLARDAAVLVHCKNYILRGAGVVNMFSHTAHVESLAVFEKKQGLTVENRHAH